MYSKLFAILLGNNKNLLFMDVQSSIVPVSGQEIQSEKRMFLSLPAFIIAEVILGLYVITTMILYIRRPWRILDRHGRLRGLQRYKRGKQFLPQVYSLVCRGRGAL